MLRTQFEEELDKLHNQFYAMGTEVLAQINKTVRAFVSHDRDLAKKLLLKMMLSMSMKRNLKRNLLKLLHCSNLFLMT